MSRSGHFISKMSCLRVGTFCQCSMFLSTVCPIFQKRFRRPWLLHTYQIGQTQQLHFTNARARERQRRKEFHENSAKFDLDQQQINTTTVYSFFLQLKYFNLILVLPRKCLYYIIATLYIVTSLRYFLLSLLYFNGASKVCSLVQKKIYSSISPPNQNLFLKRGCKLSTTTIFVQLVYIFIL